ncbi:patatin-like phospholipase family protein [Pelagibius sp. 7325]|uniref:patatin-like phospholipase family protein n=1 Tax=Pelagibius sp. 7325 TaxID=3131994 RepID=UPI0030EF51F7
MSLKLVWACLTQVPAVLLLAGCGSVADRNPLPQVDDQLAEIPGLPPDARFWGDQAPALLLERLRTWSPAQLQALVPSWYGKRANFLAVSGGGADGAFGAGLMNGWTASGTRPEFQIVTGVSTGALSAPFIFLGPDYDDELKEVYTTNATEDLVDMRAWTVIATGDAAFGNGKLRGVIEHYVDDEMIRRLSEEYRIGRRLFVGTTNLDAGRPVAWNITSIAASDFPEKRALIVDILLASASIPGAFPPVLIEVEVAGTTYDELHVDGGAVSQVFVYPSTLDFARVLERAEITEPFNIYVIRNSKLKPTWKPVEAGIFTVTATSISSLIRTQGLGDLSSIYLLTQRDGGNFRLTFVPDDFAVEPQEMFDPHYMNALYQLGYDMAREGIDWWEQPPATLIVEDK